MLICILTKNVITSCSVTMMLFLHLEVKPLMTLTTVLYLSCALISGHLAVTLIRQTVRHQSSLLRSYDSRLDSLTDLQTVCGTDDLIPKWRLSCRIFFTSTRPLCRLALFPGPWPPLSG